MQIITNTRSKLPDNISHGAKYLKGASIFNKPPFSSISYTTLITNIIKKKRFPYKDPFSELLVILAIKAPVEQNNIPIRNIVIVNSVIGFWIVLSNLSVEIAK